MFLQGKGKGARKENDPVSEGDALQSSIADIEKRIEELEGQVKQHKVHIHQAMPVFTVPVRNEPAMRMHA